MKNKTIPLIIVFLIISFAMSSAEIYKWVDENGIKHYSDSPTRDISDPAEPEKDETQSKDSVPVKSKPAAEKSSNIVLDSDFFDFMKDSPQEPVASRAPVVEIYETSWCVYCKKAKNFFRSRGIKFRAYDVEKDQQAAERMRAMTNRRGVPFVVINGKGIQGFSEEAYIQALNI